jgi:hypothetical protein
MPQTGQGRRFVGSIYGFVGNQLLLHGARLSLVLGRTVSMTFSRFLMMTVVASAILHAQTSPDLHTMRDDLFAALAGNTAAVERILDGSSKILAHERENAEALLWHGVGTMASFILDAQKGNAQAAWPKLLKATSEMDRATTLAPDDIEVRVMRAVLYAPVSRNLPRELKDDFVEKTRTDLQHTFDLQKDHLTAIGTHPLGELLQGLADANSRQGKVAEAEKYYTMIQTMLKDTEYSKRASEWMATKQPLPADRTACVGCHIAR